MPTEDTLRLKNDIRGIVQYLYACDNQEAFSQQTEQYTNALQALLTSYADKRVVEEQQRLYQECPKPWKSQHWTVTRWQDWAADYMGCLELDAYGHELTNPKETP